jgi:hypothetical protein
MPGEMLCSNSIGSGLCLAIYCGCFGGLKVIYFYVLFPMRARCLINIHLNILHQIVSYLSGKCQSFSVTSNINNVVIARILFLAVEARIRSNCPYASIYAIAQQPLCELVLGESASCSTRAESVKKSTRVCSSTRPTNSSTRVYARVSTRNSPNRPKVPRTDSSRDSPNTNVDFILSLHEQYREIILLSYLIIVLVTAWLATGHFKADLEILNCFR